MEEVNLGTVEEQRITYISSLLPSDLKEGIIIILQEFKDCFAWNYDEMIGLDKILVLSCQVRVPPISTTTQKNIQGGRVEGERGD